MASSLRIGLLAAVLVGAVLALTLAVPWLKTPVLLALANGLAVTGVIVLIRAGLKMLKPENLKPDRTARQLQKDAQLVKGK